MMLFCRFNSNSFNVSSSYISNFSILGVVAVVVVVVVVYGLGGPLMGLLPGVTP